jgi:replication factor C subunit 1
LVICASNIDFLVVGPGYETKYKYTKLGPRYTLPFQAVLQSIPNELWVDRYRPRSVTEIIGQTSQIECLRSWMRSWPGADTSPRGALVTGPPGIGKTTAVHLLVAEAGYQLVEFNASNERSGTAIRRWFEEAARSRCVGAKRIVVMDEVDGMSSGDRGGMAELGRLIRTCTFPILCIANERSPRLHSLTSCCLDIRFVRPTKSTIAKSLMAGVVKDQRLSVTLPALETLCEQNGNDIRSILNFLQFSSRGPSSPLGTGGSCTKDALLRIDAFSATGRLFDSRSATMSLEDRSNLVFVDMGLVPLMVGEGYLGAAARCSEGDALLACARSADALGDWDIFDTRIRRRQEWHLLPSAVMSIVTAARAAGGPAPFQIFPSWLGKQSKRLKHSRNLRDMSQRSGIPAIGDCLDLLRAITFAPGSAGEIVKRLDGLGLSRDDMFDTLVDTAFPSWEGAKNMDTKTKGAITREWRKLHSDKGEEGKRSDKDGVEEEDDVSDTEEDGIGLLEG